MSQKIRIKLKSYDYNLVDKSADKIVKTVKSYWCCGKWSYSTANSQKNFYCKPFDIRQQKVTRTVRTLFIQTIARYLQFYSKNYRCIDEVRAAKWS